MPCFLLILNNSIYPALNSPQKNYFCFLLYGFWIVIPFIPMAPPFIALYYQLSADIVAWIPLTLFFIVPFFFLLGNPPAVPAVNFGDQISPMLRIFLDMLLLVSIPLQIFMLFICARYWVNSDLSTITSLAFLVGVGFFSGLLAVNGGHELLHPHHFFASSKKSKTGFLLLPITFANRLCKVLAVITLSTVCFGCFQEMHLSIHHKYVGTSKDHYTARRNQTLYNFLFQNLLIYTKDVIQSMLCVLSLGNHNKAKASTNFSTLLSFVLVLVFYRHLGTQGVLFFMSQSVLAIILLEWINYLQHYGVVRKFNINGSLEPVREWHTWCENYWFNNIFLLNLFRHSDHHINSHKPYYLLREVDFSLKYPYPFIAMMYLSLVPSVFFPIAHRVLDSNIQYHSNI